MSTKWRYCRQCGIKFEYTRDDQQFHSPACVAKFYRENPNPQYIHEENTEEFWHECEWCGVAFFVNAYAQRGGQRAPKYHSNACKQAAYRARGKETQDQAARRGTNTSGKTSPPPQQQQRENVRNTSGQAPPPPPPPAPDAPQWRYVGSSRYDTKAVKEAYAILGLIRIPTMDSLRKAHLTAIRKWHPDRNPSPYATLWSQAINWAYDYLKKSL